MSWVKSEKETQANMLPNCRKCSMLRENIHASRTKKNNTEYPFEMCSTSMMLEGDDDDDESDADMGVKVHLVCILPHLALYHDGLST